MFQIQKPMISACLIFSLLWATIIPLHAQDTTSAAPVAPIVVASKDYTEQLILGNIVKLLLENAGFEVEDKIGLGGSRVVREAMLQGEVDVYVELTGSALAVHNGLPSSALPTDADKAYELAKSLDERNGIVWLQRGLFNDTYALMVRDELVEQGIVSISDLAEYMKANDAPLSICVESDFYGRPYDGLLAMQEQYGFAFKDENVLLMDLDGVYDGLRNGDCDVAEGYSTDGRQNAWGFTNLVDDLSFFPFYNPAPVVRQEVLNSSPEIADVLGAFGAYLDDATMSKLNARVDLGADGAVATGDEEAPADVALSFLQEANLLLPSDQPQNVGLATEITSADRQYDGAELLREALSLVVELGRSGQLDAPQIIVGSKDSSEQLLLGQLLVLLLKDIGYDVVDKTGLGDSVATRQALRNGDIDLYIELTGTALSVYHNLPNSALPSSPAQAFSLARRLDQARSLIWLQPGKFNETQTLVVAPGSVDADLASITDLALYMNENGSPLTLCVDSNFFEDAQNGLPALEEVYGFSFNPDNILVMAADETYDALHDASCDVAQGLNTDGRIAAWELTALADPEGFFPAFSPAPVIRQEILESNPGLEAYLGQLGEYLDDVAIRQLNAEVGYGPDGVVASGDEILMEDAARLFLCTNGLILTCPDSDTSKSSDTSGALDSSSVPDASNAQNDAAEVAAAEPASENGVDNANAELVVEPPATGPLAAVSGVTITVPTTYGVNARAAASIDAPVLGVLARGATATAVERNSDGLWVKIFLEEGVSAWVFTGAVFYSPEELEQLPISATPEAAP